MKCRTFVCPEGSSQMLLLYEGTITNEHHPWLQDGYDCHVESLQRWTLP